MRSLVGVRTIVFTPNDVLVATRATGYLQFEEARVAPWDSKFVDRSFS